MLIASFYFFKNITSPLTKYTSFHSKRFSEKCAFDSEKCAFVSEKCAFISEKNFASQRFQTVFSFHT